MRQRLPREIWPLKYLVVFKMGETMGCLCAHGNGPVESDNLV